MKRNIVLILVVSASILALFFSSSLASIFNKASGVSTSETKCTSHAGETYYGEVPEGIVCQKIESVDTSITVLKSSSRNPTESVVNFQSMKCDERKYCSQMRSCNEALFFIENCPNTQMDGNSDGVPCQKQWCNF